MGGSHTLRSPTGWLGGQVGCVADWLTGWLAGCLPRDENRFRIEKPMDLLEYPYLIDRIVKPIVGSRTFRFFRKSRTMCGNNAVVNFRHELDNPISP